MLGSRYCGTNIDKYSIRRTICPRAPKAVKPYQNIQIVRSEFEVMKLLRLVSRDGLHQQRELSSVSCNTCSNEGRITFDKVKDLLAACSFWRSPR
ncbi:uncharacterized protein LOC143150747 isoform X2 [Ptiloglossa arizonensis]|uniref:uncharacterized protein LOC143150747 isoform X2 n=1 Tax=Ptiloglossa arizonensis TaxID=3350558 RepID=UPI003FA07226